MRPDIDGEGAGLDRDFVGPEQKQHVEAAARRHRRRGQATFARHEAEIEAADACRRRMQNRQAAPNAHGAGEFGRLREYGGAVGASEGALPHQNQRSFRLFPEVGEARWKTAERFRAGAEIGVGIGQVDAFADHADGEVAPQPALADARVEHRGFTPRIGADDQQRIGLLDPDDRSIEEVRRATGLRVERRAILPAIEIGRSQRRQEALEREHILDAGEIPGDCADPVRREAPRLVGNGRESFGPGGRDELAGTADVGTVEPPGLQPVDDLPRLVGNPFLVHVVVDARKNTHDLASAGVHADRRAERIHHVDRLRLGQLPGPRLESIRFRQ